MRIALKILAVLILGSVLGLAATMLSLSMRMAGRIEDGPWKTNLTSGSAQSSPYTRAVVAIHGLFALNQSETIYYTANTDDAGNRLEGNCRYQITGRDPDARWWSITAYGRDDFLIPNPAHRYSVSKTSIARDSHGDFAVQVGGEAGSKNWIPAGRGRFSLSLRLYNPGPDIRRDPARAILPALAMVSCS
jgi:hypothetical protein